MKKDIIDKIDETYSFSARDQKLEKIAVEILALPHLRKTKVPYPVSGPDVLKALQKAYELGRYFNEGKSKTV